MTKLPNDPMILLSFVNTKLRDEYPDLSKMCSDMEIDAQEIETKLSSIDYHYEPSLNRFV